MQEILDREFGRSHMRIQSGMLVEFSVLPLPHLFTYVDSISLSILIIQEILLNWVLWTISAFVLKVSLLDKSFNFSVRSSTWSVEFGVSFVFLPILGKISFLSLFL